MEDMLSAVMPMVAMLGRLVVFVQLFFLSFGCNLWVHGFIETLVYLWGLRVRCISFGVAQ